MAHPEMSDHPSEALTAAYLDGALDGAARDAVEAHLSACDGCRAGVSLLRLADDDGAEAPGEELLARARGLSPSARAGEAVGSTRRLAMKSLAAAAVLVTGLGLWFLATRARAPIDEPIYRSGDPGQFGPIDPAPGSSVRAAELAFRWSPAPGADRYVLLVLSSTGEQAASFEVESPAQSASWPADRPPPAPGSYSWKVRALSLGRTIAESRPVPFEVL